MHHCACLANWGRDGHARGLSAVGAAYVDFERNDVANTAWAGVYVAQEDSFATYGSFQIWVTSNTVAGANVSGSHDGLLAYADSPDASDPSTTFGPVPHVVRALTVQGNAISDTAPGIGNGFGIEIRASAANGNVTANVLSDNQSPQLVVNGTGFTVSGNTCDAAPCP